MHGLMFEGLAGSGVNRFSVQGLVFRGLGGWF